MILKDCFYHHYQQQQQQYLYHYPYRFHHYHYQTHYHHYHSRTTISVDSMYDGIDFDLRLTRAKFEDLNMEFFRNTLHPVRKVLEDGNLNVRDIHDVVLVGGSTRIPKVQELLREFFNGKTLCNTVDQDEAVAYGAAVQGSILIGSSREISTDLILLDVVPLSLGVETAGGVMTKIVPRNKTVGNGKWEMYYNMNNKQPL